MSCVCVCMILRDPGDSDILVAVRLPSVQIMTSTFYFPWEETRLLEKCRILGPGSLCQREQECAPRMRDGKTQNDPGGVRRTQRPIWMGPHWPNWGQCLFNVVLEVLASVRSQGKDIKGMWIGKEEVKPPLFTENMIFSLWKILWF